MARYNIHRATAVLAYISFRLEGKKKMEASEHVARYICNKQTSYMSRCVRAWAGTFLKTGVFPEHRQGEHSKRLSLLGDEDIKEKARQWLRSSKPEKRDPIALKAHLEEDVLPARSGTVMSVSVRTVQRHMHEWGYGYRRNTKGVSKHLVTLVEEIAYLYELYRYTMMGMNAKMSSLTGANGPNAWCSIAERWPLMRVT
jgi:hypothetical protein